MFCSRKSGCRCFAHLNSDRMPLDKRERAKLRSAPEALQTLHDLQLVRPLGPEFSCSPRMVRDQTGQFWVQKHQSDSSTGMVLAEAICWQLGELLGTAQPEGRIGVDDAGRSWLSRYVPGAATWDAAFHNGMEVSNPIGFAPALVIDAVCFNDDRNASNILVLATSPQSVRLMPIDYGNAYIAYPDFPVPEGPPAIDNHACTLPLGALRASALEAASALASMDAVYLMNVVFHGLEISGASCLKPEKFGKHLLSRCKAAVELATAHLENLAERRAPHE